MRFPIDYIVNACLRSPYVHDHAQLLYLSLREFDQLILYLFKVNYFRSINNLRVDFGAFFWFVLLICSDFWMIVYT